MLHAARIFVILPEVAVVWQAIFWVQGRIPDNARMATTVPLSSPVPLRRNELWAVRFVALGLWAAVAASALYWVLSSPRSDARASAAAVAPTLQIDPQQIAALLGNSGASASTAASSPLASRVQVRGVAAQGDGSGVVILSVDGQPFKPYRTGQSVADDWVVQSLGNRSAVLLASDGKQTVTLELPASSAQAPDAPTAPGNAPAYGAAASPTPQPVPMPAYAPNVAPASPGHEPGAVPMQATLQPPGMRKRAEKTPSALATDAAQGAAVPSGSHVGGQATTP